MQLLQQTQEQQPQPKVIYDIYSIIYYVDAGEKRRLLFSFKSTPVPQDNFAP